MKRIQKIFSVILSLCLLAGSFVCMLIPASAEEVQTKWVNNNGEKLTLNSLAMGGQLDSFFSYGYYVRGDNTTCGSAWTSFTSDRTVTPLSSESAGNCQIYQGYVFTGWPAYQAGIKFTAPFTGTVKITFQICNDVLNNCAATGEAGLVLANDATSVSTLGAMSGALKVWKFTDYPAETDFATTQTYEFNVTENQNYYLICRFVDGRQIGNFWLNSLEYTDIKVVGTAEMIGHSISALDTPVVNFYVKLDGSPEGVSADVTIGTDSAISVTGVSYTGVGPNGENFTAEDYVFVYSVSVPAKRMTETVKISLVKDGQELLTTGNTYSVAEYCYAQVKTWKDAGESATADQLDVAKICTGILVYGRTAQKYFGYNTENLPEIDADLLKLVVADCQ